VWRIWVFGREALCDRGCSAESRRNPRPECAPLRFIPWDFLQRIRYTFDLRGYVLSRIPLMSLCSLVLYPSVPLRGGRREKIEFDQGLFFYTISLLQFT
jgi:hypothetical protein